jgi:hypothetical protein
MAIAGNAAPCLMVSLDRERNLLIVGHGEGRMIRAQVEIDGKKKNVPTGAAELDLYCAIERLLAGDKFYIRAIDRSKIQDNLGVESIPEIIIGINHNGRHKSQCQ